MHRGKKSDNRFYMEITEDKTMLGYPEIPNATITKVKRSGKYEPDGKNPHTVLFYTQ